MSGVPRPFRAASDKTGIRSLSSRSASIPDEMVAWNNMMWGQAVPAVQLPQLVHEMRTWA